jgi:flagellin-like hook-associated protein FlgL
MKGSGKMRLTNKLISDNYIKVLNKNLSELNQISEKLSANRKFLSISEDPANAMRAFQIRKDLVKNEIYKNNMSSVQGVLDEAEGSIAIINDVTAEAVAKVLQGVTGTSDALARETLANTLRGFQQTILNTVNAKYSDKYIFGGENTETMPFTLDSDGNLLYKGVNVDTGTFASEYRYIDIGIGMKIDEFGTVSPESALNIAFSGAELLGTGVDSDGLPNNIYNLLGKIAEKFKNNDMSDIELYSAKLSELSNRVRMSYVSIGVKSNFVSYFTERLSNEKLSASKRQTELEVLSIEEGALLFSNQELIYNACLQMGTKILQPSLLDYLR